MKAGRNDMLLWLLLLARVGWVASRDISSTVGFGTISTQSVSERKKAK